MARQAKVRKEGVVTFVVYSMPSPLFRAVYVFGKERGMTTSDALTELVRTHPSIKFEIDKLRVKAASMVKKGVVK